MPFFVIVIETQTKGAGQCAALILHVVVLSHLPSIYVCRNVCGIVMSCAEVSLHNRVGWAVAKGEVQAAHMCGASMEIRLIMGGEHRRPFTAEASGQHGSRTCLKICF